MTSFSLTFLWPNTSYLSSRIGREHHIPLSMVSELAKESTLSFMAADLIQAHAVTTSHTVMFILNHNMSTITGLTLNHSSMTCVLL